MLGIISHDLAGVRRLTKTFGRGLARENIHQVLENFIRLEPPTARRVAQAFLDKLEVFSEFFSRQTRYHVYASSLLFVYDFAALQNGDESGLINSVRLKLIDFAHVFPGDDQLDENFIHGLRNLSELFRSFVAKLS